MKRSTVIRGIAASFATGAAGAESDAADLTDFMKGTFVGTSGKTWPYFRSGIGPPVIVLHELFGWSPGDIAFTRRLRDRGEFTVYAPILFGAPGHAATMGYEIACTTHVCMSREFRVFKHNESSPICDDLRVLGRAVTAEHGPPGFGVVGLCLTGNFALAMMADANLVAPVVAEPSLPFDWTPPGRRSLHLGDSEVATIKKRIANGAEISGYRFQSDKISPSERFGRMRKEFGSSFLSHEIEATHLGNHSVFADHYVDEPSSSTRDAFDDLINFLNRKLHST